MRMEGSFLRGLAFGVMFSIPLWMSLIGWLRIL